ncbi:MAG: 3-deoxy-manno-octulosonate cytidylyltransferase [Spiribacter salinus]|uniref:3-deoxy-manno-octulosonate cytidylyltransferase n=1 Tax=Spiribacter salinus TaxID=1335746 RepID=A0A540VU74_9GAMM|nr:3-deoxy-manno-octulosonate cytidylyltransferase [Spiribacter sp.]TQF00300.1 MAG: 3-deoxy-manno-octulosonate cytidylyltransferase [Spiribacter salinus]
MTSFTVIIPARYGSTRLPGKPLLPLAGRPVIAHVWQRAIDSGADRVIVATDDSRIADAVKPLGGQVCLTRGDHPSGTDRLAEVVAREGMDADTIIVNLQGDEPLMPPALLAQVADALAKEPRAAMATLCAPITDTDSLHDPHTVKVLRDHRGRALYFSRAPIPWDREGKTGLQLAAARRHLGIYAYRSGFLARYVGIPASPLEQLEQLEQLRALEAGEWIQVVDAITTPGPGIDTAADLLAAEKQLNHSSSEG